MGAYCNAYLDLRNHFCRGFNCFSDSQYNQCKNHWNGHGKNEGRRPNPQSCTAGVPLPTPQEKQCYFAYCNASDDLKNAFCGGKSCGRPWSSSQGQYARCKNHWNSNGKKENRPANPEICTG